MNTSGAAIILSLLALALAISAAPWSAKLYLRMRPSDELRQVAISKGDTIANVKAKMAQMDGLTQIESNRMLLVQEDRLLRDEQPVSSINKSPVDLFDCAIEEHGKHVDWAFERDPIEARPYVHELRINYLPAATIYGLSYPDNTVGFVRGQIEANMAANNKTGRPLLMSYDGQVQDDDSQSFPPQMQLVFCKNL